MNLCIIWMEGTRVNEIGRMSQVLHNMCRDRSGPRLAEGNGGAGRTGSPRLRGPPRPPPRLADGTADKRGRGADAAAP